MDDSPDNNIPIFEQVEMRNQKAKSQNLLKHITTAVHILIGTFVLTIFYFCFTNEIILFTWHPLLLAFGCVLLMSEGILMLSTYNGLTKHISHKLKVQYHWIIQSIVILCLILGYIVIFINKDLKGKLHLQSWHSIFGLASVILCIPICISGVLALYCMKFKNYVKPGNSKLVHRICGIIVYLVCSVTILLSLYTKWFERNAAEILFMIMFVIIIFISAWTIWDVAKRVLKKIQAIL